MISSKFASFGSGGNSGSSAPKNLTVNAQTGTAYTLALADECSLVELTNASAITLTVPPNASVAFPIGAQIVLAQGGTGQVTFAAGAGVTIKVRSSRLKIAGQEGLATLIKVDTNTWRLGGDLTA